MEELDEEQGGEDGLLADGKTTRASCRPSVKARLKVIKGDAGAARSARRWRLPGVDGAEAEAGRSG
jgi:type I restriction enzyme M protein